jgi:hypothetical protein
MKHDQTFEFVKSPHRFKVSSMSESESSQSQHLSRLRKRIDSDSHTNLKRTKRSEESSLSSDSSESDQSDVELSSHDKSLDEAARGKSALNKEEDSSFHSDEEDREEDLHVSDNVLETLELLRGPPDGIENKMSSAQMQKVISHWSAWWSAKPPKQRSFLEHAATRFNSPCADGALVIDKMKNLTLTSVDLRYVYNKEMFKRIRLDAMMRQRGFLETAGEQETSVEDIAGSRYARDLGMIQDSVSRAYQLLLAELQFRKALDNSVDQGCPTLADPFGYVPYTEGKLSDYESFVVFLLRALHDSSYRRYHGAVYEQIMSPIVAGADGQPGRFATHAWRHVYDIKEFALKRTSKEDVFVQWQTMMKNNSLERATHYLEQCTDPEFAPLEPSRLWHSFQNGVYFVEKQAFYRYGDPRIPSHIVSCTYHDQVFDESILEMGYDFPVPHLDDVIRYQIKITPCTCTPAQKDTEKCSHIVPDKAEQDRIVAWMYTFVGRMLYEVGQKDKWQVMPFVIGRAGTGKSLLLKCVAHFFNTTDVETLANNSQKGFGLETLIDKLMWMCLEVKNDFTLDQAQLQSMISGENVSVMRKNKTALSVLWTVPGILAGNELANWVNNSGSMSRRMVLFYWERKVKAKMVDPYLDLKVKANIGYFLHKSALAYADSCAKFGEKDLWGCFTEEGNELTILPRYFHVAKNRMEVGTDPVMAFLRSETSVVCSEGSVGMSWERFKAAATNFFQKEGIKGFMWKESKYNTVFEDMGIKKHKLDSAFLLAKGIDTDGTYTAPDGQTYQLGIDWLEGVHEKEEMGARRKTHSAADADAAADDLGI